MKTEISFIKKTLVLSLLGIYMLVSLMYVLYLPQRSLITGQQVTVSASNVQHLLKDDGAANASLQFQRMFKSVIADKGSVSTCLKVLTGTFVLIFILLSTTGLSVNQKFYLKYPSYFQRHSFLDLRALRI